MANENEVKIEYGTILADLEAKRSVLDAAISSLRAAMAAGALGATEGTSYVNLAATVVNPSIHNGEVPAGAFLGKSIAEAAKLYLSIVKSKQTTREIADALLKGGMETTSSNFEGIVHAGLNRERKASGELVRVGKAWALTQWYPSGIRTQAKRTVKKSRRSKAKRSEPKPVTDTQATEKTFEPVAPPGHHPTKLWERAVQFIDSHPGKVFTAKELSDQFGIHSKVISMTLAKPAKDGLIKMTAPSTYTALQHQ